jgi:DNA-binding transcriptional regulator YiaG
MNKKHRSDARASIHETMEALHNLDAIDERTMRQFDEACLTRIEDLQPDEIRAIREPSQD